MRHPMLRGLTIVLALSLATAPTPSFALRAGLEGKTEKKIASALTPTTPIAAQSALTGLEERRLDYAAGTEITPEILKTLPRSAYVGLLQEGVPRYYQVVMRHDASPIPDARTLGLQPVNEAGQLLNDKGQPLLDEQKQPITELRATTWLPHKAILAAAPRLLKLTAPAVPGPAGIASTAPTWTRHPPDELTGLEEAKAFVLSSEQGQELAARLGSAPAGAREIAWVPEEAVQRQVSTLQTPRGPFSRPDQLEVYIVATFMPAVPSSVKNSEILRLYPYLPDGRLPAAGASVIVARLRAKLSVRASHDPILRLRKRGDAAALTPELFIAIGTNPLFMNREIRLGRGEDGTAVTRVRWHGQDGYAFFV